MLDDNSLAMILEEYRDEMRVSGALWRFYNRGKKIMFIGGAVAAFIAIWLVTIFIPSTSGIVILAAGIFAAALVIIPTFLIGTLVYRLKFKKTPASTQSRS
jgi:ABC-type dipeptide/oligopeptide/nickel transport system permease component